MWMKPTASEKVFNRFLKTVQWPIETRVRWNNPFQVNKDHTLYPDFRLTPCRLIIEIDGSVHFSLAADRDCKRDFWFEERGYAVLHIPNKDVINMTKEELFKRIYAVYPTFPYPTEKMAREHYLYRSAGFYFGPKAIKPYKTPKMSRAQAAHVQMQKKSWEKWKNRTSDPVAK